jgi:Tfp pilus assembly protein PilX
MKRAARQSGAGLVVALIMLIVMSMAAVAMVRAIGTGILVAGNYSFRQQALLAADAGSEAAINWLTPLAAMPDLYADQTAQGYYASLPDGLDLTDSGRAGATNLIDWDGNQCNGRSGVTCQAASPALSTDAAGNSIRYTIHRLCKLPGSPEDAANNCLLYQSAPSAQKGAVSYGNAKRFAISPGVYYRITTRVNGPRNTVVFTQTMVHF